MSSPITPAPQTPTRLDALDGLRTLAVFLVILFHVAVPGMAAGFIGVDVFFVLSGYLITSGLAREIETRGRIDLVRFWTRRLRRLMPAAMLVLIVVTLWAALFAPVYRRHALGGDIFSTVVYLANWHFMQAGSYFNADGNQSPLLHMWSLAVEEQFYLLWPLLLVCVIALGRRHQNPARRYTGAGSIRLATTACTALLVLSCLLLWHWSVAGASPDRAYMGTDSKAFEPLLGALVALLATRPGINAFFARHARVIGSASIVVMIVAFSQLAGPSPAYFRGGALVFSLATAGLLIAATRAPRWPPARFLAWQPMAYLGRISYGLYLWHWPLAVWLDTHAHFRPGRAALVVALTILLASLSYHFYEQPILTGRWKPWFTTRRTVSLAASMMLLISLAAAPLGGTPLTPFVRSVLPARPLDQNTVMLVGDSVPQRLLPAAAPAGKEQGLVVAAATGGGCSPLGVHQKISEDDPMGPKCPAIRKTQEEGLANVNPATIVWWSRYEIADRYRGEDLLRAGTNDFWQAQLADFRTAVDRLTQNGATLVLVTTEPPGQGMSTRCNQKTCHPFLQRMVTQDELRVHWNDLMRKEAAKDSRLRVVSMDDVACPRPAAHDGSYGSNLCDDTIKSGRRARPDGSHWDTDLVGSRVSKILLDRVRQATAKK